MKKALFLSGLLAGVVLSNHWRSLAKEGIKAGIQTGEKLNELTQKAREELEDVTAEVEAELANGKAATANSGSQDLAPEGATAN